MKNGKVSESVLKRSVIKQLHMKNERVSCGPAVGNDGGVIDDIAVATVPVTLSPISPKTMAKIGICSAVNNVSATGATPIGIELSLLIPTLWNEAQLKDLMKAIDEVSSQENVIVLGGHTQVTRAVKNCILTVTGIGKMTDATPEIVATSSVKPGMDIIMTGYAGYAGTSLLVEKEEEKLRQRFAQPFLDRALKYIDYLSIKSEAASAVKSGASALHDVSEGGVFAALWEMASASGVGLDIDLKKIPIRQETVEICEFFDINPYKLYGGGALLIAAFDGNQVVREIEKNGGVAAIIGTATDSNDRVLIQGEERRFLETAQTDELYKVYE